MLKMSSNPCKICGSIDLNLVDGFYYCVECGTQDVNARETVVEQTLLADGTFAHTTIKKFKTVLQDSIEMSGEWHKWHAYNFILAGLTDELIALGADESVKTTVMWIWVRYIKKFQIKDKKEDNNNFDNNSLNESKKSYEETNQDLNDDTLESYKSGKVKIEKFRWDINIVTKGTLLTILYIALNIDRSDIQLSHLLRFIREGRLSLYTCLKYVPKELSTKDIPHWISFIKCQNDYTSKVIRAIALTFFKRLNLGFPLVPNLNIIVSNYVKELCLPGDFKSLVLSLMNLVPCDYLALDSWSRKRLVRIPDYEGTCMSYILVALKLCFGLDDEYEIKLSDKVDKINYEDNHLKSYKLGMYSEPSERLFSFREWYKFLQFRKMILCKYYLPIARQLHMPVDDAVLMGHLEKRNKRKPKLSDEVTMDILNKIPLDEDKVTIPKNKFVATLTPMTVYTDIIQDYIQDPDFRLLMCEDFSQYILRYATKDLKLPGALKYIKGISKNNKIINYYISGTLQASKGDTDMVFVRNCDNRNWLKTKPPKIEHITKLNNDNNNTENSDPGYDSNLEELTVVDNEKEFENKDCEETLKEIENEIKFETIDNEDSDKSIFDDDFLDMKTEDDNKNDTKSEDNENIFDFNYNEVQDQHDSKIDLQESIIERISISENQFDPETFDRNKVIDELIDIACKKYKIAKPKEREAREPRKRKKDMVINEAGVSEPKKRNTGDKQQRSKARAATKELIAAYYKNIENDLLVQVSEHLKSILENNEDQIDQNDFINETVNEPANFDDTHVQADNNQEISIDREQNVSVISSIHPNLTLNDTAVNDEDINPKDDPNFDAKTHDISQLYIKFNQDDSINYFDEIFNIENDPDIEKIIEKKIDEFKHGDKQIDNITDIIKDTGDSGEVKSQVEEIIVKKKREEIKFDPLINKDISKFNYWMRHYKTLPFVRSLDMNQKFDIELIENCPKSFVFVISECAAILDCTTFSLYKSMQNLETTMLSYNHG